MITCLLIASVFVRFGGSETCNCLPARQKGNDARLLAWLPTSFCCNGIKSISTISGITCTGEGPFDDENCKTKQTAFKSNHDLRLLGAVGYHEGARRSVSCSGDGKMIGIRVGFNIPDGKDKTMYSERFISEIRILCSNGRLDLAFGSRDLNLQHNMSDSITFGASMHNASDHQTVTCSNDGSSSVVGFKWRETTKKGAGAARISGATLLCSSEGEEGARPSKDVALKMAKHDRTFKCSDITPGLKAGSLGLALGLKKVAIWFHARSLAGIDFLECS